MDRRDVFLVGLRRSFTGVPDLMFGVNSPCASYFGYKKTRMARRGRPTARVTISPSERTTLEQWARRRTTAQWLAQRAQIILACAAGRSNCEVAEMLRTTRQTAGRWRRRFVEKRLDGLVDEPRPGTPRRLSDAQVEQVITETLERTTRTLAKELELSHATVGRI